MDNLIDYKIKWLFITHKLFIKCGPYSTCGEFLGYSVGLQEEGCSVNKSIWGTGNSFNSAVEAALASIRGKEFVRNLYNLGLIGEVYSV